MNCEKCGAQIQDGAPFCSECGAAVVANTYTQATVETEEQKNAKKMAGGPSGGKKFLGVLLAILAVICMIVSLCLVTIQVAISPIGMEKLCDAISEEVGTKELNRELANLIEDAIGVDADDLDLEKELEDYTYKTLSATVKFAITGKGDPIDVDALVDIVEDCVDEIEDSYGGYVDADELIDALRDELDDYNDEIKEDGSDILGLEESEQMILGILTSLYVCIGAVVVTIFFFVLIGLTFGKYKDYGMTYTGTTMCVQGIFSIITCVLLCILGTIAEADGVNFFAKELGILQAIYGVILLLVGNIIAAIGRSIRKKRNAQIAA